MTKAGLVRDLISQRDALLTLCDSLTNDARRAPLASTEWSAHDLLGHLSYWEQRTLDHLRETFAEGKPRPMPPDSLDDNINAREAAKRQDWKWDRVRAEFENTRNALVQRIEAMSETALQFYVPSPWVNDDRIIRLETLIREDVLGHAQAHYKEMAAWPDRLSASAAV